MNRTEATVYEKALRFLYRQHLESMGFQVEITVTRKASAQEAVTTKDMRYGKAD